MNSLFFLEDKNSIVTGGFFHQNLFFRKNFRTVLVVLALASFYASTAWSQTVVLPLKDGTKFSTVSKYAVKDIQRVFSFMDANRDGKISREEVAGFQNVAKHFDEADLDKDDLLSYKEFENALNSKKSQ